MHPVNRYLDTLRALATPRRALPIALVVAAMLWAQQRAAPGGAVYLVPAGAMAVTFVLVAPFAWRALFPPFQQLTAPRLVAYAGLATVPSAVGWATGILLGTGATFLTWRFHLPITAALFAVGGWGLARDIDGERVLAVARARAAALEREAERARLLAMRAHLDPHFLFNTLNALAEWIREDPEVAEQGVLRLSALLREVLGGLQAPSWPADRELGLLRDLLELHRLRDREWFDLEWEVPETLAAELPPLLLLPLGENAVKHGPAKGHRGTIAVRAEVLGERFVFTLSNPGPFAGRRPGGEGLLTLERRLDLAYGTGGRLAVQGDAATTRVTVEVPLRPPETA